MDERYLIYKGFENDAELIFNDLIKAFDFLVCNKSDSGITFENHDVILSLSYETGIQIWIEKKNFNKSTMLYDLVRQKGLEKEYFNLLGIDFYKNRKKNLIELSKFILENFVDELSSNESHLLGQ